ncbi:hypothetical protein Cni_G28688 [Canna indica]|uniref:Endonuclease/exonuclease/phosphatase domain-containing protein n=1 Tax=Canna indica TaxID=4628 RepID=A0AAQ3L7T1_9LILI|nr:hypothetical protein Cni_G28688 [Canna indica]
MEAVDFSGGQLLIWEEDIWNPIHKHVGSFMLVAKLEHRRSGISYTFINVYGPPRRAGRLEFFAELNDLVDGADDCFIIGGDFNVTRLASETREEIARVWYEIPPVSLN